MVAFLFSVLIICGICFSKEVPLSKENTESKKSLPNILFILADDLGWGNVGYHNKENDEINTPNIDNLVANGLELNRHYVYSGCSPTRASMQR